MKDWGRIGLGCATFGREISEAAAFEIMDYAVANGIRLFDTAEAYGGGQARMYRKNTLGVEDEREVSGEMHSSEKIVGRWMKSRGARREIVLLTKVTTNFTREHVREAIAASLERLQTDSVDFYLYHSYDAGTPVEEACAAMDDAVRAGWAGAVGCSNYTAAQLDEALACSRARKLTPFSVAECIYNLAARGIETDLLPLAEREGIRTITYSPLGAGFLTGKYTPDRAAVPSGSRFDVIPGHVDIYFHERSFRAVEALRGLAQETGVPMERLALAWALRNRQVQTVLVGARSVSHLDNAFAAKALDLQEEWVRQVEQY